MVDIKLNLRSYLNTALSSSTILGNSATTGIEVFKCNFIFYLLNCQSDDDINGL